MKTIVPSSVVTAPWVRWKCQFGCDGYDYGYCCPPHTPTYEETKKVLDSYQRAILSHIRTTLTPGRERQLMYARSAVRLHENLARIVTEQGHQWKRVALMCFRQHGITAYILKR